MGKIVSAIQSSYIPWKGYFDIIHDSDVFVFYDNVQFTRKSWRVRNRIKLTNGRTDWITIPIGDVHIHSQHPLIEEIELPQDASWMEQHLMRIKNNYRQAPFFHSVFPVLESLYDKKIRTLSEFNQKLTIGIARLFGISAEFVNVSSLRLENKSSDRLINELLALNTIKFISGPTAKDYLDTKEFERHGIEVIFKDYSGYPPCQQLYGEYDEKVSIIDLLFNVGIEKAPWYIWGWRENRLK